MEKEHVCVKAEALWLLLARCECGGEVAVGTVVAGPFTVNDQDVELLREHGKPAAEALKRPVKLVRYERRETDQVFEP